MGKKNKPNVAVDLRLLWENVQPSFAAQMTGIVKGLYEFVTSGLKAQNVWTNHSPFNSATCLVLVHVKELDALIAK